MRVLAITFLLLTTLIRASHGPDPIGHNVLLIVLDDARKDIFDQVIQYDPTALPNIQNIAETGVTFSNAFAPTPVCTQARATIVTGLRTPHHGVEFRGSEKLIGPDKNSIATWFADANKRAAYWGKYVNEYGSGAYKNIDGTYYIPPGWSDWHGHCRAGYGGFHGATWCQVATTGTGTIFPGCCSGRKARGICRGGTERCEDDSTYHVTVMANYVIEFINKTKRPSRYSPGWLGIFAPYTLHGDAGANGLLPRPRIEDAGKLAGIPPYRPTSYGRLIENGVQSKGVMASLESAGRDAFTDLIRVNALESLISFDRELGRILNHLRKTNEIGRTTVILTSDNGATYGEHGRWAQGKSCPYDVCQRIPLIISHPRGQRGVTVDETVLLTDIAPTIADIANIVPSIRTDGRSFKHLILGEQLPESKEKWRSMYCMEMAGLRPKTLYKYIGVRDVGRGYAYAIYPLIEENDKPKVELFDFNTDPHQMVNVAGKPRYVVIELQLKNMLRKLCKDNALLETIFPNST